MTKEQFEKIMGQIWSCKCDQIIMETTRIIEKYKDSLK
jgi:hypothetical protein